MKRFWKRALNELKDVLMGVVLIGILVLFASPLAGIITVLIAVALLAALGLF
jgi:ABC-type bacteriocin/lantibiotic exporter with double-glycine peptidase domain